MISLDELNTRKIPCEKDIFDNLVELCKRLNMVRQAYNKPMIITSGLRSQADQMRINPKAPKSNHLMGRAADVLDRDGKLWSWCMKNLKLLEDVGLWLEDKTATPTWVHFQTVPPHSGNRIFKP